MATAAERQKRYRLHIKGDHSRCDPARRCTDPPQPPTVTDATTERGPRAQELRDALMDQVGPAQRVLLDEACRIVDRLDRLDAMLEGREGWGSVVTDDGGELRLVVDALLAESRQQATALRGLLAEVVKAAPAKKGGAPKAGEVAANVSSLAARAARRRASSG